MANKGVPQQVGKKAENSSPRAGSNSSASPPKVNSFSPPMAMQVYKPTARECALLILHLWREKELEVGKEVTRLNVSDLSLKHLWCRNRIPTDLLEQVNEWLADAGAAVFFAETTYGVIQTNVVERWTRATSKLISKDLEQVAGGTFNFSTLQHHVARPSSGESR